MDPKVPADWVKFTVMLLIIGFILHQVASRLPIADKVTRSSFGA